MPTFADIDVVLPASASADFWRSGAGTTLPDGVGDFTDAIGHNGLVGIGTAFAAANPVAQLDIASGARSGVDGRVAGVTPFYATGAVPAVSACGNVALTTPVGGFEFRHSNQTQGIGIGYSGLYATGSVVNQDFSFMQRGVGNFFFMYQSSANKYLVRDTDIVFPAGGYHQDTYRYQCADVARMWVFNETAAPNSTRFQWDLTASNGTMAPAARLRPARLCAVSANTELYVGENQVHARKLVLFDSGAGEFNHFGFGIQGSTLAYVIPGIVNYNRWYTQDTACPDTNHLIFSVSGQSVVTVDPSGLNTATANQSVGELRFGSEGSNTFISSKRSVGANQNGLDFGTGNIKAMSIGGVTNPRHVRYNPFGQTADLIPAFPSGGGEAQTPLTSYDKAGTPGNDQRPLVVIGLENAGAASSQAVPPSLIFWNSNNGPDSVAQRMGEGRISWWDTGRSLETAQIGANFTVLDIRANNGVTAQVRFTVNAADRMLVKSNVVNLVGLLVFATDALAGAGGLVAGDIYRDSLGVLHAKL